MKNQSTKKLVLAALFLALAYLLPFLTGQIPGNRQYAAANAPAGADLRLCMRMALWLGGGLCRTAAAFLYAGNAAPLPHCGGYGL